jgi:hypothetical protein
MNKWGWGERTGVQVCGTIRLALRATSRLRATDILSKMVNMAKAMLRQIKRHSSHITHQQHTLPTAVTVFAAWLLAAMAAGELPIV